MKFLNELKKAYKRATTIAKHPIDLTLDDQWARIEKHLAQENASEQHRLENQYPAGWFRLVGRRGNVELAHYCPKCKQLSQGKVALHCSGQKREERPEGWRLLLAKPATARF